jgi:hypothetical protein
MEKIVVEARHLQQLALEKILPPLLPHPLDPLQQLRRQVVLLLRLLLGVAHPQQQPPPAEEDLGVNHRLRLHHPPHQLQEIRLHQEDLVFQLDV